MHVITYSPNFAPPHFAARGIPKKHPTRHNGRSHCLHLYVSVYPFRMELFSFSLYTMHTLLHGLIFFIKYGKGREVCPSELHWGMRFRWANFSSCLYT